MVARLEVRGQAETVRAFDQLASDVANMGPTHAKVARARLAGVQSRTPVLSGALAGSWTVSATAAGGSISSELQYAAPIEYGVDAHNIIGAHMIGATLDAEQQAVAAEYEAAILDRARARGFRIG